MGAIVLAGGKSRRMGRDKATLLWEGRTLLERILEVLAPLTSDILVVADTAERYTCVGARVLADRFPHEGPLGGVITGLEALGKGAHIAVACDMPFLETRLLTFLLHLSQTECDAVVPRIGGHWEPLCAVYYDTAAAKLAQAFSEGERSLQRALGCLNVFAVSEDALKSEGFDLRAFSNWNTPEDIPFE